MAKYAIYLTETYVKTIIVEADSFETAQEKAEDLYFRGTFCMDDQFSSWDMSPTPKWKGKPIPKDADLSIYDVEENAAIKKLKEMPKAKVKVDGGELIAEAIPDDNYPGIDISFVPKYGGPHISLAVAEQYEGILRLYSYMNVSREDPDIINCSYDIFFLQEIAYDHYVFWCEECDKEPVSFSVFKETVFLDKKVMQTALPSSLWDIYCTII